DNDLAAAHPTVVQELLRSNAAFVARARQRLEYRTIPPTIVGNDQQKTALLTIQHAIGDAFPIYAQKQIAAGVKNPNNRHQLTVEEAGKYEIKLRRWPEEHLGPIWGIPAEDRNPEFTYQALRPEKAMITVQDKQLEKAVSPTATDVTFKVDLAAGSCTLDASFVEGEAAFGAYYVYVSKL
ncbi:MAG: n-acetylgalactosamine-4-sulfatase, partial [Bacteroidota bacterium]